MEALKAGVVEIHSNIIDLQSQVEALRAFTLTMAAQAGIQPEDAFQAIQQVTAERKEKLLLSMEDTLPHLAALISSYEDWLVERPAPAQRTQGG